MRANRNSGPGGDQSGTNNGDAGDVPVEKGVDFADYFCTYVFLYHQKENLSDRVRMDGYYNVVFKNKHHFHGKARNNRSVPSLRVPNIHGTSVPFRPRSKRYL